MFCLRFKILLPIHSHICKPPNEVRLPFYPRLHASMIHNLTVVCMLDCAESSAYFTPSDLHPRPFRPRNTGLSRPKTLAISASDDAFDPAKPNISDHFYLFAPKFLQGASDLTKSRKVVRLRPSKDHATKRKRSRIRLKLVLRQDGHRRQTAL
jgi:hypothetical protein